MKNNHLALRALLWFICAYHVAFGLLANLPDSAVRSAADALFGIHLPPDTAFYQVLKPFGTYAIAFGVMMGVAAWNPVKNRALISVGVVLFALRLLQRLTNLDGVQQGLGVSAARNWVTIGSVAAFGLALAWLRWRLYQEMHAAEPTRSASGGHP